MTKNSAQKTVLITGCSSGFGLLIAAHLAKKDYNVIATMRNLKKQSALLNEVNLRNASVSIKQLDVTNTKSIDKCMAEIAEQVGYVDVLINNAGYGIAGAFEDLSDKEIRDQFDTNFFGVQNVTRACIPLMRTRRSGKIINMSSISGFSASPCFGAYCASKWALEGFSESLRYELKQFNIDVLLIEPGSYITKIFTDNAKVAKNYANPQSPYFKLSELMKERVEKSTADNFKDVEEIAILTEKLIRQKRPKFRNIPDVESKTQYLFRKFLPFKWYENIVTSVVKLKNLNK
ncbi:MAG: short-subunit dehydrogenase [Lysobacterales bacterium]|jgi:short-subunit dehydrogenase